MGNNDYAEEPELSAEELYQKKLDDDWYGVWLDQRELNQDGESKQTDSD